MKSPAISRPNQGGAGGACRASHCPPQYTCPGTSAPTAQRSYTGQGLLNLAGSAMYLGQIKDA
ncbi:hypothetical protein VDBG_07027 [Verticillium alfalfae VaMs.102]|uniref:Uncharacterized protein n=1 Tax=Verticillium alfalfae (strain VaMs.102 / ATCC MYA-4576 / FGSC 10136) TaxID=526221 RepID=C9SPZ2_VERA1|nr:hypothetical protein VDBG_07027 [Verticillium alfalfae VaMs.102]EEY20917.1 hypothetical protein VDBG_07027 [Verticillium alfalfae VaMs.102]